MAPSLKQNLFLSPKAVQLHCYSVDFLLGSGKLSLFAPI